MIDFFGDAVNSRTTPRLAAVLRGLDALAVDSMDRVLRPLGIEVPPVLTYLDKGIGASILRAGARLWDASLSPVSRHQDHPTQSLATDVPGSRDRAPGRPPDRVERRTGRGPVPPWNRSRPRWRQMVAELGERGRGRRIRVLAARLRARPGAGDRCRRARPGRCSGCRSGIPIPSAGYGSCSTRALPLLVRAGTVGPPGPRTGGAGIRSTPRRRTSPSRRGRACRICPRWSTFATRAPMRAFGGEPLSAIGRPSHVSPAELAAWPERAGPALYTSRYLQRLEPMRILGWIVLRAHQPRCRGMAPPDRQ